MNDAIYDPDAYWEARGGHSYRLYTESPGYRHYRDAQVDYFQKLVAELNPERLLDFGCGSGKLFPLWKDVPEVHAYDRARSQIDIARSVAVRLQPANPYRVMHCRTPERSVTPYDDGFFDLIVVAEVLLHVVPDDIGAMIAELHRICRGHLAIVVPETFDNPAPHCFDHDYASLYQGRFAITNEHCLHNQRYLTARKISSHEDTIQTATSQAQEALHAVVSA